MAKKSARNFHRMGSRLFGALFRGQDVVAWRLTWLFRCSCGRSTLSLLRASQATTHFHPISDRGQRMSVTQTATELVACSYLKAIEGLKAHPAYDESDAREIDSWLNGGASATRIAADLRLAGFKTSATTVKDHRRGECACRVDV